MVPDQEANGNNGEIFRFSRQLYVVCTYSNRFDVVILIAHNFMIK